MDDAGDARAVGDRPARDEPVSIIRGERLAVGTFLIGAIMRQPDGAVGWLRVNILTLPRVAGG